MPTNAFPPFTVRPVTFSLVNPKYPHEAPLLVDKKTPPPLVPANRLPLLVASDVI
jgi:hypothetical protein